MTWYHHPDVRAQEELHVCTHVYSGTNPVSSMVMVVKFNAHLPGILLIIPSGRLSYPVQLVRHVSCGPVWRRGVAHSRPPSIERLYCCGQRRGNRSWETPHCSNTGSGLGCQTQHKTHKCHTNIVHVRYAVVHFIDYIYWQICHFHFQQKQWSLQFKTAHSASKIWS